MESYDFPAFCHYLNEECRQRQEGSREIVSVQSAFSAYSYVRYMGIYDAGDVLLFCTCLNTLNTYVKQADSVITYHFKSELNFLIDILFNRCIPDVEIDLQSDGPNPLLLVEISGVQFSFHNPPLDQDIILRWQGRPHRPLVWDQLRKQKCAQTLLHLVEENSLRFSNLTFRGKNLKKRVQALQSKFEAGKIGFDFFNSPL